MRRDTTVTADVPSAIAPARQSATDPAFVPEEEDCGFIDTPAHPDPDDLITKFLRRDAGGQFLRSESWFDTATTCPGHEPGPDFYTVIEAYSVTPVLREPSRVQVAVTSQRLGYRSAEGFESDPGVTTDTVTAVLTPYGWRIQSPALRQHVLASTGPSADSATVHERTVHSTRRRAAR